MLDFPSSPTVGQRFPLAPITGIPTYTWDGEKWTTVGVNIGVKKNIFSDGSVAMEAQLTLVTPPVATTDAASKQYVDDSSVSITGDTMTGSLVINGAGSMILVGQKGNLLGTLGGTAATGAVATADACLLLYNTSSTNWAGMGVDANGSMWFKTGITGTPAPALYIDTAQVTHFTKTPIGVTATAGDNSTQLATTAWVLTNALNPAGGQQITGGFSLVPKNLGTPGSFTPNPLQGNYQYLTNNGAFTLSAPTVDCAMDILVTNGVTAGTISFSGFTVGANTGDPLTTTSTQKFILSLRRINAIATYTIKALQ